MEKKKCKIENCDDFARVMGMCSSHYHRFKRYGDPLGGPRGKRAKDGVPMKWLMDHLAYESEECLKWPFADRGNGYGAVVIENGKTFNAHVVICTILNGKRPSRRHVVAHSCGKGHLGCVNPRHLRWATHSENMLDKAMHGTAARGERNPFSKLTAENVLEMRRLYHNEGWTQSACARLFGVGQPSAGRAIDGITWSWLK